MKDGDIPTFELAPEQAALIRLQHDLDHAEAGPKAPVPGFLYKGVRLESRFSVLAELDTMRKFIDALPELMVRRLVSIWCDSGAGANYMVEVRAGRWAPELEWAIRDAIMTVNGGHNGVAIDEGNVRRADIDPDWNEDI